MQDLAKLAQEIVGVLLRERSTTKFKLTMSLASTVAGHCTTASVMCVHQWHSPAQ